MLTILKWMALATLGGLILFVLYQVTTYWLGPFRYPFFSNTGIMFYQGSILGGLILAFWLLFRYKTD